MFAVRNLSKNIVNQSSILSGMSNISKPSNRSLWTIAQGQTVGYIENVMNKGFLFKNPCIMLRETSSNLAASEQVEISIHHCNKSDLYKELMRNRVPVSVDFDTKIMNSPLKGRFSFENFATDVKPLDSEKISVLKGTQNTK